MMSADVLIFFWISEQQVNELTAHLYFLISHIVIVFVTLVKTNHTTLLTRLIMTHILTHCLRNPVVKFKDLV